MVNPFLHFKENLAEFTNDLKILEKLSGDENWYVRESVAHNLNCTLEILEKLSNDEDWRVRHHVMQNPNCSISILEKLSEDEDWYIKTSALENLKRQQNNV